MQSDTRSCLRYVWGVFFTLLSFMLLQHLVFMLRYLNRTVSAGWAEALGVPLYGMRLDVVITAYLTALPLLITLLACWMPWGNVLDRILRVYYAMIVPVVAYIYTIDLELYGYWDFRMDASALLYMTKPKDALASLDYGIILLYCLIFVVFSAVLLWALWRFHGRYFPQTRGRFQWHTLPALLLSGGLLFLGMRSSVNTSTANVGMVYHSTNQYINQASINPVFNVMATLHQQKDLTAETTFFDQEECDRLYRELNAPRSVADSQADVPILRMQRPNVVMVILESFSANAFGALGCREGVTPVLDQLAQESWLFTRTYASSFRTDRGLAAVLSGYPGQPSSSILEYSEKSRTLPSIAAKLKAGGYSTHMLYGGDIDFANMRSYFLGTGYEQITDLADFPLHHAASKWGVRDEYAFDFLAEECVRLDKSDQPFFYTFLTLSSHEPFDVPNRTHTDPYLNSVAYTDGCIDRFIKTMRQNDRLWSNTLFVFVADHGYPYPEDATPESLLRYHIVHLWSGGVLDKPRRIDKVAAQTDLPATLLNALGLQAEEFTFSKNVFAPEEAEYAFFTFPNLVGLADESGASIYNFTQRSTVYRAGNGEEQRIRKAQSMLQKLMEDMQQRGH